MFYQPLNAVGKLPEAFFLLRCDFFFLFSNLHAVRSLFGKRQVFKMNLR